MPSGDSAAWLCGTPPITAIASFTSNRPDGPLAGDRRGDQPVLTRLGRPELATVMLAVIRGLLMDLDATGDTARTDRAFHDFLTTIGSA